MGYTYMDQTNIGQAHIWDTRCIDKQAHMMDYFVYALCFVEIIPIDS